MHIKWLINFPVVMFNNSEGQHLFNHLKNKSLM
jgi:hypothetical protein